MEFNLTTAKEYFNLHRRELAGFILMLLHLEEGEQVDSVLGTIRKLEENKFEVIAGDRSSVNKLVELWEEVIQEPVESIFVEHGSPADETE